MRIEFRKSSHKRRRNIFDDRLDKDLNKIIVDFYSARKISLDKDTIAELKKAMRVDTVDVLLSMENPGIKTSENYLQDIVDRAIAIMKENKLDLLPEFKA